MTCNIAAPLKDHLENYLARLNSLVLVDKSETHNTPEQNNPWPVDDKDGIRKFFTGYPYFEARMSLHEVFHTISTFLNYGNVPSDSNLLSVAAGPLIYDTFYGESIVPAGSVVSMDINIDVMKQGHRLLHSPRNLSLIEADMIRMPFMTSSFDIVFSYSAIHWTNALGSAVRELIRVTKPGGMIHITYNTHHIGKCRTIEPFLTGTDLIYNEPFSFWHPGFGRMVQFDEVVLRKGVFE